jgi:hypothetical protein
MRSVAHAVLGEHTMFPKKFCLSGLIALGAALPLAASATTVTFTEVPGLWSGQTVTTEWASFGLDLSGVYWYEDTRDPFDNFGVANVDLEGTIRFLNGTSAATVDWVTITTSITLEAYDAADNLLDSFSTRCATGNTCSGTETLTGGNIAYLKFRDGGGTVAISTVTFDHRIPEPATLALAGLALAGLGAARRRRQG